MNPPEVHFAKPSRVIRRRNVRAILESADQQLLALIAAAWGTGKVGSARYGFQAAPDGSPYDVPQAGESTWRDTDDPGL